MIDKELVDKLRAERKISKTAFPKLIGMSGTGYKQMWENNSMKVETLEKIAQVLGVAVAVFFESPKEDLIKEDQLDYNNELQTKLIQCMEKKEELYERLLLSEAERKDMAEKLKRK